MKLSAAILAVSCSLAYASRDLTSADYAACSGPEQSGGSRPPTPPPKGPSPWSKFGSGTPAGAAVKPAPAPDSSSSKPESENDGMPGMTQRGPAPTFDTPGYTPETSLFLRQAEGATTKSFGSAKNRLSRAMSVDTGRSTYSEPTYVPEPISQFLEPPQSGSEDDVMPGRVLEIEQATAGTYTRLPQKPVQTRPRSKTIDFPLDSKYRRRYQKTKKQLRQLKRDYQELEMRVQDRSDQDSSDSAVKAISQKHGLRNVSTFSALRSIVSTILLLNTAGYGEIDANGVSIPSHGYGVNGCYPIEKLSAGSQLQWYGCPTFGPDGIENGTAAVAEIDMQ